MASAGKRYVVRGRDAFDQLVKLERRATQIFLNQPLFVPGLLQVAGYAAEMISKITGLKSGDPELADRIDVRMQRAGLISSPASPELWAVIDEAVLRRVVGGPEVMREQLRHLIAMSEVETVHLGIIPMATGAHAGQSGSFEVHEVASQEAAVFFEGAHEDEIVGGDPELAQRYRATVETMMESAVRGDEATALLKAISSSL